MTDSFNFPFNLQQGLTDIRKTIADAHDLIARYEAGERNFKGIQLHGVKILKNINLSGQI
jgi:hypothetical protein